METGASSGNFQYPWRSITTGITWCEACRMLLRTIVPDFIDTSCSRLGPPISTSMVWVEDTLFDSFKQLQSQRSKRTLSAVLPQAGFPVLSFAPTKSLHGEPEAHVGH